MIRRKYESEKMQPVQSRGKNFFILIAHSQGNFFAEGVAYRLLYFEGASGQEIFNSRLGILSLGSPTNYSSLPNLS